MKHSDVHFLNDEAGQLTQRNILTQHSLDKSDLFQDEELLKLIESHPRKDLHIHTMGSDPTNPKEWRTGELGNSSAKDLLEAVSRGKLWLNIVKVDVHHEKYRKLLSEMYESIESQCPHFRSNRRTFTLLISSPKSMVYYHADPYLVFLWQLRGKKRIWLYPFSEKFAPQKNLEKIFTREVIEDLPYQTSFDKEAEQYDLLPGQMISWIQNAPHRVENIEGINVSITTNHYTSQAMKREYVYCANRYFNSMFGLNLTCTKTSGILAFIKMHSFRVARKMKIVKPKFYSYEKDFTIDLNEPDCIKFKN